ncbi:MAG TPA: T9SS type A sorting domain-containing protein [Candidatus Kapabacteria bacterium]|nr:T9SS type A sorting domain-containing protein [Candidatus Kapabacteria bacterium]
MKKRSSILIALFCAVLLGMVSPSFAATWYVNTTTGNDANTGVNPTNVPPGTGPKKTIQAMVNGTLASGDIISIAAGTYDEQVVVTDKSITLQGAGAGSTIIRAVAWAGLSTYTDAVNITWTGATQGRLPGASFRPVIYVNASNTNFTVNITGLTVDANSVQTGNTEFLVGVMYKNAQGRIGSTAQTVCSPHDVRIINCRRSGAPGPNDTTLVGFGVVAMANSVVRVSNCEISNFQNAGVLSLGRTTNTVNRNLQPNPEVTYCRIKGFTRNTTSNTSGSHGTSGINAGYMAVFGGRGVVQNNFIDSCTNTGSGIGAGIALIDPFTHTIGGNNRTLANTVTANEVGLYFERQVVPVGLFPPTFTIQNNTFAYNGNGLSGATATGGVLLNDKPAGAYTLNVSQNAWGNAAASTLYNVTGFGSLNPTNAFFNFRDWGTDDNINRGSAQSAGLEYVDCTLPACDALLGYVNFPTIQKAVDAAAINVLNPTIVNIASCNYAENVVVQKPIKLHGDTLSSCGGGTKPVIIPTSGNALEISSTSTTTTQNVTVNGVYFKQAGTQRVGILVVGHDNTAAASNRPPQDVRVRNSCFEGYATQAANGDNTIASAAMSTEDLPTPDGAGFSGRFAYGGGVDASTDDVSDVDASANNNFNYLATSTDNNFKLWEKTDGFIATGSGNYDIARIIKTDIIIIYCGDDMEAVLNSLGTGPVTVYLQGDCVYKSTIAGPGADEILTINGNFEIKVDYTGRVQLPPVVVAKNGIRYSNGAVAGISWDTDCTIPTKPGVRFITRDAAGMPDPDSLSNGDQPSGTIANASATHMKSFVPLNYGAGGFDYEVANYGFNRPTDIAVDASENGALLDAVSHIADSNGFAGTVTLDNAAAFTTNLTLQKRIRFAVASAGNASTTGWIRLINKAIGAGPCFAPWGSGAINGILDTRVTSGTFTSLAVEVGVPASATATDWADNSDTTNTIQQGLVFTAASGTCTVNYRGNYTNQAPTISRNNVTLTSDNPGVAGNFVGGTPATGPLASITLNGSGACGGTASDIVNFNVPIVYMANNLDCIQTALGNNMGNQHFEGVGNSTAGGLVIATAATPRTGTVAFTYGGATAVSQTLTLDKDVKFDGDNTTANTNAGSLTMRLGAYGNPNTIVNSDNFCNTTVNVTQETGSTYTTIPDIQDGILLACTSGTVNIGNGITVAAAATTWGAVGNDYNRDNTINKALTVQGLNNPTECANDPAFVIDAATAWGTNAARINTATFSTFTANAPIFTLASGVNNITLRGFDFSGITLGAADAVISAPSTGVNANNNVTIQNNFITSSGERFIRSASTGAASTFHTNWNVSCNRMTGLAASSEWYTIEMIDHTQTTLERNYFDGTGSNVNWAIVLRGFGGPSANTITRNVFQNVPVASNLFVGNASASNSIQNVTISQNRLRGGAAENLAFENAHQITGNVTVNNNFLNNSAVGIFIHGSTISHQFFAINNNSFENTNTGIRYDGAVYSGTVCQINARGNWWENVSGPTSAWNPLNPTPCTAAAFGDAILQNGTCSSGDQSMISFIPWWTLGTDANAAVDGWQQPAATNVLARVVRTDAAGTWLSNHATIQAGATAIAANNERVIAIQGIWGHLPAPGLGDDWGEFFSEEVSYDGNAGNYEDNEFRGTSIKAYDCTAATMRTWHTYLVGTNNVNGPVPSGDGVAHAPAVTIDGLEETGFYINGSGGADADGTMIRNFRIQGFSSVAGSLTGLDGQGIIFDRVDAPDVDACWVEGSNNAGSSSIGIYFDRCTNGTIRSTMIGHNKDISGSNSGLGIMLADRSAGNVAYGPNTVGQSAATAFASALGLGITNGHNIIRNCERVGINVGFNGVNAGSMGATVLQYNTIRGIRDSKGLTGSAAVAAIVADATGGSLTLTSNTIGGKGLQTSTESDNNVDVELFSNAFTFSGTNNIFRDSASVDGLIDGESHVVRSVSGGARGAEFRTFFNPASGNTFSHAVILTRDARAPWDFSGSFNRNQDVVAISGAVHIHRAIQPSLSNTSTVFSAGSETYDNVVEIRENAGWTIGELGEGSQYYWGDVTFPSNTGRMHQTILGPAVANALNATSAHILSGTLVAPGSGVAVTANGAENKYIRGGIVMHAVGNGLYGRISTGAANKGDVYLQRAGVGGDAGFVQFAYGATFGTQALVAGTGVETTGNNSNTDKPTIIKAGLDDANDDAYTTTSAQNRRTGVFQAGNGTAFTRETEPTALAGGNTVLSITPNPTTGTDVTVTFRVPYEGMVKVALYNALGQKVTDLRNDVLTSGVYSARFDVNNLVNGQYYVRFETEYFSMSQPVSIIK